MDNLVLDLNRTLREAATAAKNKRNVEQEQAVDDNDCSPLVREYEAKVAAMEEAVRVKFLDQNEQELEVRPNSSWAFPLALIDSHIWLSTESSETTTTAFGASCRACREAAKGGRKVRAGSGGQPPPCPYRRRDRKCTTWC